MTLWPGYCPTHLKILPEDIVRRKQQHPRARVVVHPECHPEVIALADEALSTSGIIDVQSSLPFVVAEGVVLIAASVWYYRYCTRYPHLGPILAILPLFFAWRSLWSYFFYAGLTMLAGMLVIETVSQPSEQGDMDLRAIK